VKKTANNLHWLEGSECTGWSGRTTQCPYCLNQKLEYIFELRYEGIIEWEDRSGELSSQYEEMYLDEYAFDWQVRQGLKSPWF